MTGALALALIVVRFVASAAIARPLSDERRLDVEHPHETVRTLRAGCALDARTRLDADPDALTAVALVPPPPRHAIAAALPAPLRLVTATAPRAARARAPPRVG